MNMDEKELAQKLKNVKITVLSSSDEDEEDTNVKDTKVNQGKQPKL